MKINENVEAHLPEGERSTAISVIDIYGFEVFGVNRYGYYSILFIYMA